MDSLPDSAHPPSLFVILIGTLTLVTFPSKSMVMSKYCEKTGDILRCEYDTSSPYIDFLANGLLLGSEKVELSPKESIAPYVTLWFQTSTISLHSSGMLDKNAPTDIDSLEFDSPNSFFFDTLPNLKTEYHALRVVGDEEIFALNIHSFSELSVPRLSLTQMGCTWMQPSCVLSTT